VTAEDDVQEDDVEMTVEGGVSSAGDPPDEDPIEKQMCLSYESQVRVSTVRRYGMTQTLDQLEEWMKENPIPYISNDKISREGIFDYWVGRLPGHAHVNQTYPDVVRASINTKLSTCDDKRVFTDDDDTYRKHK
jgi:hypothetical protein